MHVAFGKAKFGETHAGDDRDPSRSVGSDRGQGRRVTGDPGCDQAKPPAGVIMRMFAPPTRSYGSGARGANALN